MEGEDGEKMGGGRLKLERDRYRRKDRGIRRADRKGRRGGGERGRGKEWAGESCQFLSGGVE